jgi:cobalt-zinc-cadmium efflux system outer membrane protein
MNSAFLALFLCIIGVLPFAGCAVQHYQADPIISSETGSRLQSRTLADPDLKQFLEVNLAHPVEAWPLANWDLNTLTLAALYFSPQMQSARAQADAAASAIITAKARPNPILNILPGIPSPYLFGLDFDVPIETHGKRGIRTEQAQDLSESAHVGLAIAAWKVRSQVRQALITAVVAEQRLELLRTQNALLTTQVDLLQKRLVAGEVPRPDVDVGRVALLNAALATKQAESQISIARASLASALGVPLAALENVQFSWPDFQNPPAPDSFSPSQVQREAVVDRLDIRAALLQYAAAEQALKLEIARQYPDFSIGPGYQLEESNNFFTIVFSTVLPVFNRNHGPIAEAEAARKKAAADFLAVQAQGIAQTDAAFAGYRSPFAELQQARTTLVALQTERATMQRRAVALGESDQLTLSGILLEGSAAALAELDALSRVQTALGSLEDAVQRPLQSAFVLPQSLQAAQPTARR